MSKCPMCQNEIMPYMITYKFCESFVIELQLNCNLCSTTSYLNENKEIVSIYALIPNKGVFYFCGIKNHTYNSDDEIIPHITNINKFRDFIKILRCVN